ncbi:MAG: hypothetical protein ACREBG_24990 [Pyrinomonadaceae bacterium]
MRSVREILDTLLLFTGPLEQGIGPMLLARGALVFMLIRYVNKQRAET